MTVVYEDCAIATADGAGTKHATGYLLVEDGRIARVGPGRYPHVVSRRVRLPGCLATPGLVNTHHHLYQWATRGLARQANLFDWLTDLYPRWAAIDADVVRSTTRAGLGWLALSGCTTSTDHHYIHPAGGDDLFAVQVAAAAEVGLRFHPVRGSMDLGVSQGGLPPDELVESTDGALEATAAAIDAFHDPAPGSMLRVAVGPCSPFSVTEDLMRESAALARDRGVRMHTHLAETKQEEEFCRARFGCDPVTYAEKLDWLGPEVWLAHAVHVPAQAIAALGESATAVAHCPSSNGRLGAGIAPVRALLSAGVAVGLGVDGPASQEYGHLGSELRQALIAARQRDGSAALTADEVLAMATAGGAACLGRGEEIGSLEVGKLADIAFWDLSGLGHAGIADPVTALVFGPPARVERLLVGGRAVVSAGALETLDLDDLAADIARVSRRMS